MLNFIIALTLMFGVGDSDSELKRINANMLWKNGNLLFRGISDKPSRTQTITISFVQQNNNIDFQPKPLKVQK
jgi:hypothetical protein